MRAFATMTVLLALFLTGCMFDGFNTIIGSGNAVAETRNVTDFDSVSFSGDGELSLTQAGTESLTVAADDNILPVIETYVRGSTLIIKVRDHTSINTRTPIRYTLSVKDIESLTVTGDGNVVATDLQSDQFELKIHGDGDVEFAEVNAPDFFTAALTGDGSFSAATINTSSATVRISGDGDVSIDSLVAQELASNLAGDGSLTVAGEAASHSITITGDGNVLAGKLFSNHVTVQSAGDGHATVWATETMDVSLMGDGDVAYIGTPQISQRILGDGSIRQN